MRAIICDDDEIILKGLCSVVDWPGLGIEVVGTASDGKAGLQLLREMDPELLLSDIRMPYIDGLELIREGRKVNPELQVIVFSGYDDFEYVRQALRLGVQDYLTKPIDMEELTRQVRVCVRQYVRSVQDAIDEKENLLRKVMAYEAYEDERLREMENCCCQLLILESEQELGNQTSFLEDLRGSGIYVLTQKERRWELVIVGKTEAQVDVQRNRWIERLDQVMEKNGTAVVTAVSSIRFGIRCLGRLRSEAEEALGLKYVKGYNQNLSYQQIRTDQKHSDQETRDKAVLFNRALIEAVKGADLEQAERELDELEARLTGMGTDSFLYVQFMVGNLYSSILQELDQIGIRSEQVLEDPVDSYGKLLQCDTIHKACAVLREHIRKICACVKEQQAGAYSESVYKALRFIGTHYNQSSLSQEEAAAEAGLSTGRFSTLFKNETGSTFTDYLLKIRMEKAKELMQNPNMKIYEIAWMCGYENIPYFSTAFKKYTGVSPTEYRSKRRNEK